MDWVKLTDKEIEQKAIERYGNDQHNWSQQREGFIEGMKQALNIGDVRLSLYRGNIEKIAKDYHDREVCVSTGGSGDGCPCCKRLVTSVTCIEHDSQDYSKDLWICSDCYFDIHKWWKENKPCLSII